jgi:hypothetical protein
MRSRTSYRLASICAILFVIAIFINKNVFFIAAFQGNYKSFGGIVYKCLRLVYTHSVSLFFFLAFSY